MKMDGSDKNVDLPKGEHLQRTKEQFRQDKFLGATISDIQILSPTVKGLTLDVVDGPSDSKELTFKAGQWVDFIIPGIEKVGGYSMCSPPIKLENESKLDLAVKSSTWPPAQWVHQSAKVGSKVQLKIGGNFFYPNESTTDSEHNLLLIAGGVGINPIASIIFQAVHLKEIGQISNQNQIQLLFSAKSHADLLFKEKFDEFQDSAFTRKYFLTDEKESKKQTSDFEYHRINRKILSQALANFNSNPVYCFICGPNPMITSIKTDLVELGVQQKNIFYELWW